MPRFTSTQSAAYTRRLSDRLKLSAIVTNTYVGSREETTSAFTNGSGNSNIPVSLPSYDLLSARVGLITKRGWSAYLFADNLTDNQAPLSAINSQVLNIPPVRRLTIGRPRTIGIDLSISY